MLVRLADVFDVSVTTCLGRVPNPTGKTLWSPSPFSPDSGWSVAEDLIPEGAGFKVLTRSKEAFLQKGSLSIPLQRPGKAKPMSRPQN